jgi:glycosyltransferase involved in cell wall biosynthesis
MKARWIIMTHAWTDGPGQALATHLNRIKQDFVFASSPLLRIQGATAEYQVQKAGESVLRKKKGRYRWPRVLAWLQDFFFALEVGFRYGDKNCIWIGVNSLNALAGCWLKVLGKCSRVIYYVIDYTPLRFENKHLNQLYQTVCTWAAQGADWIWNLSEPMRQVHIKNFGTEAARNLIVPIGVAAEAVRVNSEDQINSNRLVIVSALFPDKGIQCAIGAMRFLPGTELVIVGDGPYRVNLEDLARTLQVQRQVSFLGSCSREVLFAQIACARVALAPYLPQLGSISYYADPAKPKEYLACGVPVVITAVPWIAEKIGSTPMGVVVAYDSEQIAAACRKLIQDNAFWMLCRKNALAFMSQLSWQQIFSRAIQASGLGEA